MELAGNPRLMRSGTHREVQFELLATHLASISDCATITDFAS